MKQIISWLLCLFCIISCTDDDESNSSIQIPKNDRQQTIFADATSLSHSLAFTTTAAWSSRVEYVADESDVPNPYNLSNRWVNLGRTQGGAGQHVLDISFKKNYSGKDREAKVFIECEGARAIILIKQLAIEADGSLPSALTRDGKEPYVICNLRYLPSYVENKEFHLHIQTNLRNPRVEETDSIKEEYEKVGIENIPAFFRGYNDTYNGVDVCLNVLKNTQGVERKYALQVIDEEGNIYGVINLTQPKGPHTKVVDIEQVPGCATLHCVANDSTRGVSYFINERKLSTTEIEENFSKLRGYMDVDFEGPQALPRNFKIFFSGLNPNTVYYVYIRSNKVYSEYSRPYDVDMVQPVEMKENSREADLVLTVSANPANGFDVYLPLEVQVKGTVDWGDGTIEEVDDFCPLVHHRYDVSKPTLFDVRFNGVAKGISYTYQMGEAALENTLVTIKQWGFTNTRSIDFNGCSSLDSIATDSIGAFRHLERIRLSGTNIEEIPEGFFDYAVNVNDFSGVFSSCKKLKRIPNKLFRNPTAQDFSYIFSLCESLERIPEDLFAKVPSLYNVQYAFAGCVSLTSIPEDLFANCPLIPNFSRTFAHCTSLKSIPEGLFRNNRKVTSFGDFDRESGGRWTNTNGTFHECTALTAIPENLFANNTEVRYMSGVFANCKSLTTVPAGLLKSMASLESVEAMFAYCYSLQTVPVSLFDNNRRIYNFEDTFSNCVNWEGESPYTISDGVKYHLYERDQNSNEFVKPRRGYKCFRYCEKLTDYKEMPNEWR